MYIFLKKSIPPFENICFSKKLGMGEINEFLGKIVLIRMRN